jgi:glycine oxidase
MPRATPSKPLDVIVIGGGLIGCSIAMRLAQARLTLAVLDRGEFGGEASSAAAGMLAAQGETIEPEGFSNLCLASRDLYPNFISELEELTGQKIDYRPEGTLLVGIDESECRELTAIFEKQTRHGLRLELLSGEEARHRVPALSPEIRCALFASGDHWLDNVQLCETVSKACSHLGAIVMAQCEVVRLNEQGGRFESIVIRSPKGGAESQISAGLFILAAGCWSNQLVEPLGVDLPLQPCRGQIIEFEASTELPYVVRAGHHYLVPRRNKHILAGTTAEYVGYKKEVTAEGLSSILAGVMRLLPLVKTFRFCRAWAGLRPDTPDHLPVLGYGVLKNLVFAAGHFRNGILLAPITARLISELVLTGTTS